MSFFSFSESDLEKEYLGYDDTAMINISDNKIGSLMLDKMSRIDEGRRVIPLDHFFDNAVYQHRILCDEYNLVIGDTCFIIPPEFIMVSSESQSQRIITLRQENSAKEKPGYHKRTILIDLVFNGINQINGFPVDGPQGTYYVDGLRQLLAQFKCTPILPITNELINSMYEIYTVALQSITMSTVEGYPDAMTCQITLQEIEMFPYINVPNACFEQMIDWDLFRFYYQSFLTEKHEYKKLQSLDANKEHNRFKISILDEAIFTSKKATKGNLLNIITDQLLVTDKDTNYTTFVSSEDSDVHITQFNCGYSNLLTNIQLSDSGSPTLQFLGGMDTIYNIVFETTDYSVVQNLEQCQMSNDILTRNNIKFRSLGFVKLESELVEFTGSLFVMIESVSTNTVPGFPGLYNVQVQCVSYDIAQSERESLNGFMPFDCNKEGKCSKYENGNYVADHTHDEQVIDQSMNGLYNKIKQDNYAEWKIRSTMEVYPDLRLPKYSEVNKFISDCIEFRKNNNLPKLPYTEYPKAPTCFLHGLNPNNTIQFECKENTGIIDLESIKLSENDYDVYVDPDFYVFYPCSYASFLDKDGNVYGGKPYQRKPQHHTFTVTRYVDYNNKQYSDNGLNTTKVNQFISLAQSFIGNTYKLGAAGDITDSKGKCFDCSGFVTYLLKEMGVIPSDKDRYTVSTILTDDEIFETVDWNDRKKGDLLCDGESHVVIYEGDNKIIHASNSAPYPQGGVKESNEYFVGTVRRIKSFVTESSSSSSSGDNSTLEERQKAIWDVMKSLGYSDYAAAGVIGCWTAESSCNPGTIEGNYLGEYPGDDSVTSSRDAMNNWAETLFSKYASSGLSINRSAYKASDGNYYPGIGLAQWTGPRGKAFLDFAGNQWKQLDKQVEFLVQELKNSYSGANSQMQSVESPEEAASVFCKKFEGYSGNSSSRQQAAREAYEKFKGTQGNYTPSNTIDNSEANENTLTQAEFNSICKVVDKATQGEPAETQTAIAQVIYDRLTNPDKKFGGLSNILNGENSGFDGILDREPSENLKERVRKVFCENNKYWQDAQALYFLTPASSAVSYKERDKTYDRLDPENVGMHTFWGKNEPGSNIQYSIVEGTRTSNASDNNYSFFTKVLYDTKEISNVKQFGVPVFIKTDAIIYDENFFPWNDKNGRNAQKNLNSSENIFNTSFCDEVQYSGKGRLVRAFPAYLFCILDEDSKWFDGRKLWTNYYVHKAVIDIAVHSTNDMPTSTATIVASNSYHNLDRTQGGMSSYSLGEDTDYDALRRWWYKQTNTMLGFGPKLTKKLIELHQIICNHAKLREGARVHLRMGYGSDPLALAPVINGHISDVTLGDQISIVVTSDGHELIQNIVSSKKKDTNNGWLGLFGLGESQESSNIIANILCKRQSWVSHINGKWFEASKYNIEHFGLYFNKTLMRVIANTAIEFGKTIIDTTKKGNEIGEKVGETIGSDIPIFSDVTTFIGKTVGTILGAKIGLNLGIFDTVTSPIVDIWDGWQEQYDILKNIYKANYKRQGYIYTSAAFGFDKEKNIVFNKYNMTPWDMLQICTQQVPEYIVKPEIHQFDSRVYFGLPFWMEKYRYDVINNTIFEECKTAAQVHFIDSMDSIIDNQVRVTSKFSNTNVKVMYTRGSSPVSTKIIHSDITIDASKQKTVIIDSPICQDALGPDALFEKIEYDIGRESARRLGISNLLYGWQQQYQGSLICIGCPGVKPHDYLMVNDSYINLMGISVVREVVHSFSTNTGFTTSITPGMVSYSTDRNSSMIPVVNNYLMLLECFAKYTMVRKEMRNNYEKYLYTIGDVSKIRTSAIAAYSQQYKSKAYGIVGMGIYHGATAAITVFNAKNIFKFITSFFSMKHVFEIAEAFKNAAELIKAAKGFINTWKAIKAGTVLVSGAFGGWPAIIAFVVFEAIEILLDDLFEWLENRNVCVLLPMWWEGYPFVAGVKDGTKILLCDSNSTATEDGSSDRKAGFDEYDDKKEEIEGE